MPKIIENVRELLLDTAKEQIRQRGYGKTTIRSVASACGLGVGTVYNYFKSKDMLIASFMLEDWQECLLEMRSHVTSEPDAALRGIHAALVSFLQKHQALFSDSDAAKVFVTVFGERHRQLRGQLQEVIMPLCSSSSAKDPDFLAEFIAEALLTWTVEGKSYDELSATVGLLLK